jgi:hypothetical protein
MANLIKNTTDGTSVLATAQTITVSELISGGSVLPGDILEVISFVKKNVTTATLSIRFYVNTANNLTGATQLGIYTGVGGTVFGYTMGRNFVVKSATSTITFPVATGGSIAPDALTTSAYGDVNIDWSINQYFIVALSHSSGLANDSYSTGLLVLKR